MSAHDNIVCRVYDWAQREPERLAFHFRDISGETPSDRTYTYGQLWATANSFASALAGIPGGGHVMIVLPLGLSVLAGHLGVLQAGGVPSIFTHPSEKIQSSVYDHKLTSALSILKPDAVITCRDFYAVVKSASEQTPFKIVLEEDVTAARAAGEPAGWRDRKPADTAIIQYSSGSTGMQKAVALSHEMVLRQCESYGRFIGLDTASDHICSWLPLYHDMGLFTSWLMPVVSGIPVSMIDPFLWVKNPVSFLHLITDFKGTLCWLPNFTFNVFTSRFNPQDMAGIDLSSMRGFSNCSEPVSAKSMRDFAGAFGALGVKESAMWVCYAMAENAFAVTHAGGPVEAPGRTMQIDAAAFADGRIEAADSGKTMTLASCGVPVEGCEVKIVDDGRAEKKGAVGEIAIHSPFLLREYFRNPEATQKAIEDGWYYSGDLGFMYDGRLYVTGRKKDLLIVGGRNFYPQDIERICDACAGAGAIPGRCVALGLMDEKIGTQKVIILVESKLTDPGQKARLAAKIRQDVFEELDCPVADVRVVPHMWLLKTSSGKIARQPNLERYSSELVAGREESGAGREGFFKGALARLNQFAWAALIALGIVVYLYLFVFGTNESWNLYAGF